MDESLIEREPWLGEHVGGRSSLTELENLHGVLNNPAMAGHAFFYFHDPACIHGLPEDARREMGERSIPEDIEQFGEAEAKRRTQERKTKLEALKERILESGLPVLKDYPGPEAPGAANPLFLRTVPEELRQSGSFEQPPDRVPHYLEARTPEELLHRVIRRWQEDFDAGRQLVRRTLLPLWAAGKGLSKAVLIEVMAHKSDIVHRPCGGRLFRGSAGDAPSQS